MTIGEKWKVFCEQEKLRNTSDGVGILQQRDRKPACQIIMQVPFKEPRTAAGHRHLIWTLQLQQKE